MPMPLVNGNMNPFAAANIFSAIQDQLLSQNDSRNKSNLYVSQHTLPYKPQGGQGGNNSF